MPMYEYRCIACGHTFEELVSSSGDHDVACPQCKAPKAERQLSAVCARTSGGGAKLPSFQPHSAGGCGGGGFT